MLPYCLIIGLDNTSRLFRKIDKESSMQILLLLGRTLSKDYCLEVSYGFDINVQPLFTNQPSIIDALNQDIREAYKSGLCTSNGAVKITSFDTLDSVGLIIWS